MEFQVLGPLRVVRGTEEVYLSSARKPRLLLAALLAAADQPLSAERLIEIVWDGAAPSSARRNLQQYVHQLRLALGPEYLVSTPSGYTLAAGGRLDAARFSTLADQGMATLAAGDACQAHHLLTAALDLWRGQAFEEFVACGQIAEHAERLEQLRLAARHKRLEAQVELGRHTEAAVELAELAREYPFHEDICALLMLACYRSGRPAEALAAYRTAREELGGQLGLEPGPELTRLHLAVLNRDASLLKPAAPPRQAAVQGLPATVPAFTGRAAELDGLTELTTAPASGPVVLSGPGGVGKTALAVHWGHSNAGRYPDGQLYVNLRGYDEARPVAAAEALGRFLRALGTPPNRIPLDEDEAAERYRSALAGRRMLILLDNASTAEQVRPLLPGEPGCQVVVTSRDRLTGLVARDGARGLPLGPLSPAEAVSLISGMIGSARATAEPEAVGALAEACDRLPLALRIAAAQLAALAYRTVAEHLAELAAGGALDALAVPGDPGTAVRAVFGQSYARLPEGERRLFRRLGLVPGSDFTPEGAAALGDLGVAGAGRLLAGLAEAHLVEMTGPGRFGMHDLLREYAKEICSAEDSTVERAAAVGRLQSHYVRYARAGMQLFSSESFVAPGVTVFATEPEALFAGKPEAQAWLDAERSNLTAAICAAAGPGQAGFVWRLAHVMRRYFGQWPHLGEWFTVGRAALGAASAAGDLMGVMTAESSLGLACIRASRYAEAIGHFERAAALSGEHGWTNAEALDEMLLGLALMESGDLRRAAACQRRALALNEELGNAPGIGASLGNLAGVHFELGDLAEARGYLLRALEIRGGTHAGRAPVVSNLGIVSMFLGRYPEALGHLTDGLACYGTLGEAMRAGPLNALSELYRDTGDLAAALDHARQALAAARPAKRSYDEADALNNQASAQYLTGHVGAAITLHTEALELAREAGLPHAEISALVGLSAAQSANSPERGAELAADAVCLARQRGYRLREGIGLTALASAELAAGRLAEAESAARAAAEIHQPAGYTLGLTRSLAILDLLDQARKRA
ncbi:AfsR/SARP family transcriptional regulator [Longispora albida]|uniref:AfsR/SARP family transcriptional regulator n=1 Tax=Longispora albida TaxID=203523 RepID=UPI0003747C0B|nr:AfsR/SARP family transcriptional regulator [Longispora albida]